MVYLSLLSFFILWALCVLPGQSWWFRPSTGHSVHAANRLRSPGDTIHKTQGSETDENQLVEATSTGYYTYSVPDPQVIKPTLTSQGMVVTSVEAAFAVCNTQEANTSSCSTVFQNFTTSLSSTILTAWFTSVTITDCNQNITFSTESSYLLATATPSPITTPAQSASQTCFTPEVNVQSVISYFIAPWQSLAAHTPF